MKQLFMLSPGLTGITCLTARQIVRSSTLSSSTTITPGSCKEVNTVPFTASEIQESNIIAGPPASPNILTIMKQLLFCLAILCLTHAKAQTIKSDDYFKHENQRFIQTADQPISKKDGITASVFFGTTQCSNGVDTLFSIHFSVLLKKAMNIEAGSTIQLNFADGSTVSIPDQQRARAIPARSILTPNCYLDMAAWKKIMQVNITEIVFMGSNPKLEVHIPVSYQEVIPNMVRTLYTRGRNPYNESL
jgi:hypothetical protein